ncbi:nucleotide sugar dehydrogenase [Alsobacter soli]|uniref:Nucleotide sugar dehydrogenase n=1 Tax=Alsobacter soli TaxID=2109933 RepID=A0A2T1HPX9_9HYPH|nr:nucleotide sugar dehydrogenase [Alsobacter soli]PSC03711.1 nucleotide sugar dehydrogenase [Alsobacter soli]
MEHGRKIAVVGLGYVGLPVAVAFGRSGADVVGFDIDGRRIAELKAGEDRTREVDPDSLAECQVAFTSDPVALKRADFFIVTVPTPIDDARRPDLTALRKASQTVGAALKPGDIVVYESTVYPGATEEDCGPILEKASGLAAGRDFTLGYSPERINPGDHANRFETIRKVVSGQDAATTAVVANVYGSVVEAGIYVAPSIRVAEAAKVIENSQRDLNIAFVNELSALFQRLGIDTLDVLAAAGTKWNFLPFSPGLVGGHCIGVDPYYLTHRAERAGYHPQVILAGRRINDSVGSRIASDVIKHLLKAGRRTGRVTVLGLTFKEDVPDIRNTRVVDIVRDLASVGLEVQVVDPLAAPEDARHEYGLALVGEGDLQPADAVVLAVPHRDFVRRGWDLARSALQDGVGLVYDVKGKLDRAARPGGVTLMRL